jgi:hypothetical protein
MLGLWNHKSALSLIVSVGSGLPATRDHGRSTKKLWYAMQDYISIATETEQTAESFAKEHSDLLTAKKYLRLNVQQGLEKVGLEEYDKRAEIIAATKNYLQKAEVRIWIDIFVTTVAGKNEPQPEAPIITPPPLPPRTSLPTRDVDGLGLEVIHPLKAHTPVHFE